MTDLPAPRAAPKDQPPSGVSGSFRVLVVTNLWPTREDPAYGSFVEAQMESLRAFGVAYDVVFIDGRKSRLNYARGVLELRRRLAAQPYDLVHAHFGLSGWVARMQGRVPVVVSFMGDDVLGRFDRRGQVGRMGRLFRVSSFVLARLVAAAIVKSKAMKDRLRLERVQVIPNGVDLDRFRPMDQLEARRALGLDGNRKYVIFPYHPAIPNKRFDLVEQAAQMAGREVPELELLTVAGKPRAQMPLYFNAADVLVMASHSEGSPNVVKEAMAVNLPVISVGVGDVAEVIAGVEGCCIVPRRAEEFAACIVDVCRRARRTEGRERMGEYAEDRIARRIVEVYAGVTAKRRRGMG
jgi:glycosyltransferase involved in cell wall biosynthesis